MNLLLGSNSPRRKELLSNLGYSFSVVSIDCEENFPADLLPEDVAGYLSEKKAFAYDSLANDQILLTADTVVCVGKEILGKPNNQKEALEMLMKLSDNTHQVYTAITICTCTKTHTKTDVAMVNFEKITEEEALFYINQYRPFDKAGGYGIQEWLGMSKISKITGSYYTIMGLPTHLVYTLLQEYSVNQKS